MVAYPDISFFAFSGCISVFLIHYVSYFPCFLVVAYPAISFLTFFGVHFRLPHTLCFIFSLLFSGRVPRYFIFNFFSGYIFVLLIFYVSYFPCFLAVAYPDISFLYFSGYAPSRTSLIMASAHSYSPKTYPNILFLTFLWVRASSHFTYCGFSTLLFTKNVPQHFIFAISRGTTLHHTIHTLPPTTHKSILWRRFAPEYAFFSFSCVSNSVPLTGSISNSTTYSIIFVFRFQ